MAVQFAQPYRFNEQQLARMAEAGVILGDGTALIDGVPYWAGAPVRFSREAYYRLGELGILSKRDHVERIDGEIIAMTPAGSRHSACVSRLNRFLTPRISDAIVRYENPLALPQDLDPGPDFAVVRARLMTMRMRIRLRKTPCSSSRYRIRPAGPISGSRRNGMPKPKSRSTGSWT